MDGRDLKRTGNPEAGFENALCRGAHPLLREAFAKFQSGGILTKTTIVHIDPLAPTSGTNVRYSFARTKKTVQVAENSVTLSLLPSTGYGPQTKHHRHRQPERWRR